MKRAGLVAVLAVLSFGCVSAKVFRSGSGEMYAPTRPDSVLVYFTAEEVGRPFEVIGEIMTEGSSGWGKKDSNLVTKAQQKAGEIGAQAIIVTKMKGASVGAAAFLGSSDKVHRVQAIRFTDQAVSR